MSVKDLLVTPEKEHHLYGGSTVKYWSNCFGWASLYAILPHEEAGEAADRGTALHTGVLEHKAKSEINHRLTGEPVVTDYKSIPNWPEEGAVLAEEFWDIIWEKELEGFITGKMIYIEKKLMLFPELDCGGTGDIVILYTNDKGKLVARLGDCKFGRVLVPASDEQLKFYLVCLNKIAREKGKVIDEFHSFVYQPEDFPSYKAHKFSKSEIERAEEKYLKAITESKKENPKFKAGDWCQWCKIRGQCATYTKYLDKEMEMTVIRNQELSTVEFRPVETIPDDILVKISQYGEKLTNYISAVKKEIILRFAAGKPVAGVRIVEGTTKSKFGTKEEVITVMQDHGVDPFKEAPLKGIGDMTSALMAAKRITKKEADKIIKPLTIKPEGPPKITTLSDPKPDYVFKDSGSLLEGLDDDCE